MKTGNKCEYIFIVDIRAQSGFGHISRSSILARELSKKSRVRLLLIGEKVVNKHLLFIKEIEYFFYKRYSDIKRQNCNILFVDDYGLEFEELTNIKVEYEKKILFSDEPTPRCKFFDYILDINLNSSRWDYLRLGLDHNQLLIGKDYNLIHNIFFEAREAYTVRPKVSIIGVYLGHQDIRVYEAVISMILKVKSFLKIIVFSEIFEVPLGSPIEFVPFTDNLIHKMKECDVVLGSAGTNAWERAAVGIPSIYLPFSDMHKDPIKVLAKLGFGSELNSFKDFGECLKSIADFDFRVRLKLLSEHHFALDGKQNLVTILSKICVE